MSSPCVDLLTTKHHRMLGKRPVVDAPNSSSAFITSSDSVTSTCAWTDYFEEKQAQPQLPSRKITGPQASAAYKQAKEAGSTDLVSRLLMKSLNKATHELSQVEKQMSTASQRLEASSLTLQTAKDIAAATLEDKQRASAEKVLQKKQAQHEKLLQVHESLAEKASVAQSQVALHSVGLVNATTKPSSELKALASSAGVLGNITHKKGLVSLSDSTCAALTTYSDEGQSRIGIASCPAVEGSCPATVTDACTIKPLESNTLSAADVQKLFM